MNRTSYAVALFAALSTTAAAHAQMNATSPTFEPAAAEPATQQSPDFVFAASHRLGSHHELLPLRLHGNVGWQRCRTLSCARGAG